MPVSLHIMPHRLPLPGNLRQESLYDKQQTRSLDKPLHSTRSFTGLAGYAQSWLTSSPDAHVQPKFVKQAKSGCNSPTKIRRRRATLSTMRLDTDHCKVVTDKDTIASLTNNYRPSRLGSLVRRRVKHRVHATASPQPTPQPAYELHWSHSNEPTIPRW